MRTVYVIHAPQDLDFVERTLIAPLPSLGIDGWVSARHLRTPEGGDVMSHERAMASSEVIIAVISRAAVASADHADDVVIALRGKRPIIPVRIDDADMASMGARMAALPRVDLGDAYAAPPKDQLRRELGALLPAQL